MSSVPVSLSFVSSVRPEISLIPRIWLHVGTQKTGTTAMQQWCMTNAHRLREAGVIYVRLRKNLARVRAAGQCAPLANALRQGNPVAGTMLEDIKA